MKIFSKDSLLLFNNLATTSAPHTAALQGGQVVAELLL